ncbi:hypothetical protein N7507_011726 [Penicillium longicatenatum]|nr:hypothetical protein N7507_011726 [Penicillium longicatenatum]
MDLIDSVSLDNLSQDTIAACPSRVMKEDKNDNDVGVIYTQLAKYLFQLFEVDFDRTGGLPSPQAEAQGPTPLRPLTSKVHSTLQHGGFEHSRYALLPSLTFPML